MKTLNRLLILALSVTLLAATYVIHTGMKQATLLHENIYLQKATWMEPARQVSLFGVLIWCVLFAKSEPAWVRVGLIAVLLSFVIMALRPGTIDPAALESILHK